MLVLKGGQRYQVWVVPALFCARQYSRSPLYLPENSVYNEGSKAEAKQGQCRAQSCSCKVWRGLEKQQTLQVVKPRNTSVDRELFVDYDMKHSFN